jgi:hypothetical protein
MINRELNAETRKLWQWLAEHGGRVDFGPLPDGNLNVEVTASFSYGRKLVAGNRERSAEDAELTALALIDMLKREFG